jgi:hypothetical protein
VADAADNERTASSRTDSPQPAWQSEDLAGMYDWDPEGGFHNSAWYGTLSVEHPCVYIELKSRDGIAETGGEALRSYVRLPGPLTRYDASTGQLWVGGSGPMTTGDEVALVGSEGWQQDWNQPGEATNAFEFVRDPRDLDSDRAVCFAHVSLYAASVSPAGSPHTGTPKTGELSGLGLYDWDAALPQTLEGVTVGAVLVIEPPCVYLEHAYLEKRAEDQAVEAPFRFLLSMPRPLVRYDSDTGSLWFGEHGPFTTGDKVLYAGHDEPVGGWGDFIEAGCYADEELRVTSLDLCDSPSKYAASCAY